MEAIRRGLSYRRALIVTTFLWAVYAVLTLLAPVSGNSYKLTSLQLFSVQLTVIIPILLIWLTAVYGAAKFKEYAVLISKSTDGQALDQLTDGLLILVFSLIVQGVLGVIPKYFVGKPLLLFFVFLHNHVPMIIALIAIILIYQGSTKLARLANAAVSRTQIKTLVAPLLVIILIFAGYLFGHINHSVVNGVPNFASPGKWPFFTLVVPYLFIWTLGLLSILNVANYIKHVKGVIYRQALSFLAAGILAVLAFTMILQLLTLSAAAFSKLALGPVLLIVYLILILYALGFVLIAMGARKLTRIEAV